MNKLYHNDQAYIADQFLFEDDHIAQTARLAHFKINSYKLSLVNTAFSMSRYELSSIIKNTLLNYKAPSSILYEMGFFSSEFEN